MISLRTATKTDVVGIVNVHLSSFENFFLTFLGRRFLELMYHEVLREPNHVAIVAESQEGEILGFVAGVTNQTSYYHRLVTEKWFVFALASVRSVFRQPSIVPRLFRALKYTGKASAAACPALLLSIAVSPNAKGKGIGRLLVQQFLTDMAEKGVTKVCLTTDRDNNQATNNFYRKLGFTKIHDFETPEGRWMCEYMVGTQMRATQNGQSARS